MENSDKDDVIVQIQLTWENIYNKIIDIVNDNRKLLLEFGIRPIVMISFSSEGGFTIGHNGCGCGYEFDLRCFTYGSENDWYIKWYTKGKYNRRFNKLYNLIEKEAEKLWVRTNITKNLNNIFTMTDMWCINKSLSSNWWKTNDYYRRLL